MIYVGKLGDCCKVIAGQSPKGSSYNDKGQGMEFHQGKKAFGKDIIEHSGVWTTEITKVAEAGDILMSVRAPVGPTNYTNRKICIGRGLAAIRCTNKVLPSFVHYALKSIEDKITGKDGAVFDSINKDMIEDLPIPILSLSEQQRIVNILDKEFEKIDRLRSNAELNLRHAKDLFQAALRETFHNHSSWRWDMIGKVCKTGSGGTPLKLHKEYYVGGTIPWLRSGEVCNKYIDTTEMFITELGMGNSSAKWFPENSVLVAMYGATAGQVGILKIRATTNQAVCGILPNEKFIPEFLYYSLLSAQKDLVSKATGNAQPNISQIKIKETSIPILDLDEQTQIVATLDELDAKCNILQDNYTKTIALCDDLKQSLLRKAFNGEL